MKRSDEYKQLAKGVLERARHEQNRTVKAGWKNLAEMYFRLAEQSEENVGSEKRKGDPILDQ
jgi:hypothetical protein